MAKKKTRSKTYKPRPVNRFPTILLNAEPFGERVEQFKSDLKSCFLQLYLGADGRAAYERTVKLFLLGELLSERYQEQEGICQQIEDALNCLIDACVEFETTGVPDRERLTEIEGVTPLLVELVSKAPMHAVAVDMAFINSRGAVAVRNMFRIRENGGRISSDIEAEVLYGKPDLAADAS